MNAGDGIHRVHVNPNAGFWSDLVRSGPGLGVAGSRLSLSVTIARVAGPFAGTGRPGREGGTDGASFISGFSGMVPMTQQAAASRNEQNEWPRDLRR
jgi:hypothetical protein